MIISEMTTQVHFVNTEIETLLSLFCVKHNCLIYDLQYLHFLVESHVFQNSNKITKQLIWVPAPYSMNRMREEMEKETDN